MHKNLNRLLALLFIPAVLALGACSTNPATGEQSFTAFMSPEREKEIGAEEHPKIIKSFGGVYGDVETGAYVAGLGARLSQHSEMPGITWTFTVLNDSKVNAFALPGGYVYITRGLMALASNEAEVVGVLSHEIGHVTARHTAQRYSTTMATSLGLRVLGALGQAAGIPSGAGNMAALGAQMALQSYSRDQEMESDMLGVRYMTRAGYSPDGMTTFFEKLRVHQRIEGLMAGDENAAERANIMATHPRTAERIEQAVSLAAEDGVSAKRLGGEEYLNTINGMIFGDDLEQGLVRDSAFIHPGLGIRFEVPTGFVLINMPTKVVAKKGDDAAIIFDMASPEEVRKATGLKDYVQRIWAKGVRLNNVERIRINAMDAVTAVGAINTQGGRRDLRLVAIQGEGNQVFRLLFISTPQLTSALNIPFRHTTYSFTRLSEAEIADAKPYRIRLHTIQAGDSAKTLAEKLPMTRFRAEWFEALNAIAPNDALQVGETIKLISE